SAPQKRPRRSFSAFHARYTTKLLQVANPPKWSIDRTPDLRRGGPGTQGTANHRAPAPTIEVATTMPTRDQSRQPNNDKATPGTETAARDNTSIFACVTNRIPRWSNAPCWADSPLNINVAPKTTATQYKRGSW